MTDAVLLTGHETATMAIETPSSLSASASLRDHVREFLRQYFLRLDTPAPTDVYTRVLAEVEAPMLEIVLRYVGQNQSSATRMLAISRGTLRKKMRQHGLLPSSGRKKKAETR